MRCNGRFRFILLTQGVFMGTIDHNSTSSSGLTFSVATRNGPFILLLFLLLPVTWPSAVYGASFRIMDQGAAAAGQSDAFTAQADDPSAIHYNPAGMMQLRRVQTYLGTNLIGGSTSFRNGAGQTARGDFNWSIA
jgi:hypothetical protein